jgi:TadE-like protein
VERAAGGPRLGRRRRERDRDERGAVAVELALTLPILIMLVFGIIEFGITFNRLQGLHAAAREGARVGAVDPGSECGAAYDALSGMSINSPSCSVSGCPGDSVVVTLRANSPISIPLVGDFNIRLTGRGEFRCEV